MAESLRRLVNIGTFQVLQEKLERWLDNYHYNSCDQNVARGCEIIELNSKVQGQLFRLLSICAQEGGLYGGASTIKNRLLPFLGSSIFASGPPGDSSLGVIAEAAAKNREIDELTNQYEDELSALEADLRARELENQDLRDELAETKEQATRSTRSASSDKLLLENENRELRRKLTEAQDELVRLRAKSNLVDDLERQIRSLKSELYIATSKASYLESDTLDSLTKYRYQPRTTSPLSEDDPVQRFRENNLISRWNDLFSQDRLDAMDTLRRWSDSHENNQRIIFEAVKESFNVAKTAFRQFKMKVRSNLAITHLGPETLEEAVQDYINRNVDLYDAPGMVSDVIRRLNSNPFIYLVPETTFAIIQPFIRECVKIAWQMSALAHPLDIAVSSQAELFDEFKYRRSYDSEYTAPLVDHHIWPSLCQGKNVRMKGECCTKRGASLSRRSRSPTRSRSASPNPRSRSRSRSVSPSRRSRSPSPRRLQAKVY